MKFFYLDEDEKSFFTQWYANGEDVIACGHENSDVANAHCAFRFENYSENENEGWIQCPALCQQTVFMISFFSVKVKIRIFSFKNEFLSDGNTFL